MSLITAADAIAALNAAGHRAMKSPARSRGGCQTLCYLVDGQYVNLVRLRELAREVLSPKPAAAKPAASLAPLAADLGRSLGLSARGKVRAQVAPIVAAIAAAPKPVRLNATAEPTTAAAPKPVRLNATAEPTTAAALLALEALAAGGPLDCATWQALGWPFEGFLAWAQDRDADRRLELMRATIRERGPAACLDLL